MGKYIDFIFVQFIANFAAELNFLCKIKLYNKDFYYEV